MHSAVCYQESILYKIDLTEHMTHWLKICLAHKMVLKYRMGS